MIGNVSLAFVYLAENVYKGRLDFRDYYNERESRIRVKNFKETIISFSVNSIYVLRPQRMIVVIKLGWSYIHILFSNPWSYASLAVQTILKLDKLAGFSLFVPKQ